MASKFLFLVIIAQIAYGSCTEFPKPSYCESYIPPAAQIVYNLIEQTKYAVNAPKITAPSVEEDVRRPLQIPNEVAIEEGRAGKKELTPSQKELLHLHTLLIREAKIQRLSRHQKKNIQRADTKDAAEKTIEHLTDTESDLYKAVSALEALQFLYYNLDKLVIIKKIDYWP
ncbi:hypothetical protein C0J52_18395 [Blattella germanica]|nr:hypothetical protein C0J52_18395 [Blattella germanica]